MPSAAYWEARARHYAQRYGINATYFTRQIRAESGFNPGARSPAGAIGIAQIMPATARGWGVNPSNPEAALNAAAKHMAASLHSYHGDWRLALAAYNAGAGAVQKYHGVPPYAETRAYISRILGGGNPHNAAPTHEAFTPSSGSGGVRRINPTITAGQGLSLPAYKPVQVTVPMPQALSVADAVNGYLPQQAQALPGDSSSTLSPTPLPASLYANVDAIRRRLLNV